MTVSAPFSKRVKVELGTPETRTIKAGFPANGMLKTMKDKPNNCKAQVIETEAKFEENVDSRHVCLVASTLRSSRET